MKSIILEKKQIRLKEDNSNAFVSPSADGSPSALASDIAASQKDNPQDDKFVFNTNDYDGNSKNDSPNLDIKAKNPQDAQQQYQNLLKNPNVKQMLNKTNTSVTVDLQQENRQSIYTKKELSKMLF